MPDVPFFTEVQFLFKKQNVFSDPWATPGVRIPLTHAWHYWFLHGFPCTAPKWYVFSVLDVLLLLTMDCAQPTKAAPPQPQPTHPGLYYGHKNTAWLCGHFMAHLFACPEYIIRNSHTLSPTLCTEQNYTHPWLLLLLSYWNDWRLPSLHLEVPWAIEYSFLRSWLPPRSSATTHSNNSWSILGKEMFQLQEINWMEHKMCPYLDWKLNVDPPTLKEFEDMVYKDFAGPKP